MGVAKELVFTGRAFSADEAVELGIANRAVPPADLASTVAELAAQIAQSATVALGLSKQMLDASLQSSLREIAALEAYGQAVLYTTNDHAAARASFIEKKRPEFTGT
jgi:2-(1,2-epoxy-1,2-dihydrophenyl)acetyl-CoA isomerase